MRRIVALALALALVVCAGCAVRTTERNVVVVDGVTLVCSRNVNTMSGSTSDERCVQVKP